MRKLRTEELAKLHTQGDTIEIGEIKIEGFLILKLIVLIASISLSKINKASMG